MDTLKERDGSKPGNKRAADRSENSEEEKSGNGTSKRFKAKNDGNDKPPGPISSTGRKLGRPKSFLKKEPSKKIIKYLGTAAIGIKSYFQPIKGNPMGEDSISKNYINTRL